MDKKIERLVKAMKADSSYNEVNKKEFKLAATGFLKELAKNLNFTEVKVSFNPGGVAVSGDATLMGMYNENEGVYISFNSDGLDGAIMFRPIKSMKDYRGGNNVWFNLKDKPSISKVVDIVTIIKKR